MKYDCRRRKILTHIINVFLMFSISILMVLKCSDIVCNIWFIFLTSSRIFSQAIVLFLLFLLSLFSSAPSILISFQALIDKEAVYWRFLSALQYVCKSHIYCITCLHFSILCCSEFFFRCFLPNSQLFSSSIAVKSLGRIVKTIN